MIEGVIYKYTAPNGKCYIGQTTNEKIRREQWNTANYPYAGEHRDKISKSLKSRKVPWTVKMVNSEEYRSNLKKVIQLILDGKFIKEYSSAIEAAKENNFNSSAIYRCLIELSKSSFGYKWIYKEKYHDNL